MTAFAATILRHDAHRWCGGTNLVHMTKRTLPAV